MLNRLLILLFFIVSLQAASLDSLKTDLVKQFYTIGAIKIENTTLKNSTVSPIYFDLRMIISYPEVLQLLARAMQQKIAQESFDCICAVPYAAVPLTAAIAFSGNHSMIMQRKEAKNYGTKKLIEGFFKQNDNVIIIEDVMTTGSSILQTAEILENAGLIIKAIYVVIDREHRGSNNVKEKGYTLHSLFTMSEIIQILLNEGYITNQHYHHIKQTCIEYTPDV